MSKKDLFNRIVEKYGNPKEIRDNKTQICCPAHDDNTPSCSLKLADDKILVHCHAGCESRDVIRELNKAGLWERVDAADAPDKPKKKGKPEIVYVYEYHTSDGSPVFKVTKSLQHYTDGSSKKLFSVSHINPHNPDEEKPGLPHTLRTLYRLPHVLTALQKNLPILYLEGEKDVDTAYSLGLPATCHPLGALDAKGGKWHPVYGNILKDSEVIILADNDKPGRIHADAVAIRLEAAGARVRIAEPLGNRKGYDLTDFINDGHTKKDVRAHLRKSRPFDVDTADIDVVREFEAASKAEEAPEKLLSSLPWRTDEDVFPQTDADYAKAFIRSYGHLIRYVHESDEWVGYANGVWCFGQKKALAVQALLELAQRIKWYAAEFEGTDEATTNLREQIIKSAQKLESAQAQRNVLAVASTYPEIRTSALDYDKDAFRLCVRNGVVDLRSGELLAHTPEELCASQAPVHYESVCGEPEEFLEFLRICLEDDERDDMPEVLRYLQLFLGSILIGNTSLQKFILLFGAPNSGKSTLVKILVGLLGEEFEGGYARTVTPGTFCEGRYNDGGKSATPELAKLVRARFVSAGELDKKARLADNIIKAISGNGRLSTRQLHERSVTYNIQWTLCAEANQEVYTDPSEAGGMVRRIGIIPFDHNIKERLGKAVPEYHEYILKTEAPALLAWMVQGAVAVAEMGNVEFDALCPARFKEALDKYLRSFDTVRRFAEELMVRGVEENCSAQEAFEVFLKWCEAGNESGRMKKRHFIKDMQSLGYDYRVVKSRGGTVRGFYGARVVPDWYSQLSGANPLSELDEDEDDTSLH